MSAGRRKHLAAFSLAAAISIGEHEHGQRERKYCAGQRNRVKQPVHGLRRHQADLESVQDPESGQKNEG